MTNITRILAGLSLVLIACIASYNVTLISQYENINLNIYLRFNEYLDGKKGSDINIETLEYIAVAFYENETEIKYKISNISQEEKEKITNGILSLTFRDDNSLPLKIENLNVFITKGDNLSDPLIEPDYIQIMEYPTDDDIMNTTRKIYPLYRLTDLKIDNEFAIVLRLKTIFPKKIYDIIMGRIIKNNKNITTVFKTGSKIPKVMLAFPKDYNVISMSAPYKPGSGKYILFRKLEEIKWYETTLEDNREYYENIVLLNIFDVKFFIALTGLFISLLFIQEFPFVEFFNYLYRQLSRILHFSSSERQHRNHQISSEHDEACYADSGE